MVANALVADFKKLGVRVKYDNRDTQKPGWKFNEYELKGVPVRIAIGPKDLEKGTAEVARRDTLTKSSLSMEGLAQEIASMLDTIQVDLFERAKAHRDNNIHLANTWDEFMAALDRGGFVSAHWDGTPETEDQIKDKTKATIRCIPLDNPQEGGQCILTGKPSTQRVLFARAY